VSELVVPQGLIVQSHPQGTKVGSVISWTDASLAKHGTVTYTVKFKVGASADKNVLVDVGTVSLDVPDSNMTNNVAAQKISLSPTGPCVTGLHPAC
jgi:hypothetical protein